MKFKNLMSRKNTGYRDTNSLFLAVFCTKFLITKRIIVSVGSLLLKFQSSFSLRSSAKSYLSEIKKIGGCEKVEEE